MRLTKTAVAKLDVPPGRAEITYYDDDMRGFGVRARRGGKRSWVAVYRIGNKVRRVTIGDAKVVGPEEARAKARKILASADLGEDTQAKRKEEQAKAATTFGIVVNQYIKHYVEQRQRPKTQHETKRYLLKSWKALNELPLHQIARRDVAATLADIVVENGSISANRARIALHGFFVWAMQQGIAEANPVAGTAAPASERKRDRFLTNGEIRSVWIATEPPGDFNTIVRLLLLTGQRREEVGGMRWSELDLKKALWSLPGDRTKNGQPHDMPLADTVLQILKKYPHRADRDLVFGQGKGSFAGWSNAKTRLDERTGLTDWRIHDLRRTAVTGMAEIGIQPHVIEAVVNHASGHKAGVAGVYNRATYAAEKRSALEKWAHHVSSIVSDYD